MGKDKLIRKGTLPSALHVDINLVHNSIETVKSFHATAPEHAKVFELSVLKDVCAGPDFSDNSDSGDEFIWEEELWVDV